MNKREGGCLCGAIRYELSCKPVTTIVCHCKQCQKQSGSAFSVVIGMRRGALKLTKGEPRVYYDLGDSGLSVSRHFCADCGSPLMSDFECEPGLVFVKAGTLDETSWIHPEASVWMQSAQAWNAIHDTIPSHARNRTEVNADAGAPETDRASERLRANA